MKGNEEEEVTLEVLQEVVLVLLEPVLQGQEAVVGLSEPVGAQQGVLVVFGVHVLILHSKQLLRHSGFLSTESPTFQPPLVIQE